MRYLDRLTAIRIQAGDVQSFEALISLFKSRIFSYCLRMIEDHFVAEDLTQEIFLKVYRNINDYDWTKASLSTWIYSITRNTCLNYLRDKEKHQHQVINGDFSEIGVKTEDPYLFLEDKLCLVRALNKLAPEDKELVIMKDYLDLKYRDIGQILQMPTGTVKSLLHGIRARLRKILNSGD